MNLEFVPQIVYHTSVLGNLSVVPSYQNLIGFTPAPMVADPIIYYSDLSSELLARLAAPNNDECNIECNIGTEYEIVSPGSDMERSNSTDSAEAKQRSIKISTNYESATFNMNYERDFRLLSYGNHDNAYNAKLNIENWLKNASEYTKPESSHDQVSKNDISKGRSHNPFSSSKDSFKNGIKQDLEGVKSVKKTKLKYKMVDQELVIEFKSNNFIRNFLFANRYHNFINDLNYDDNIRPVDINDDFARFHKSFIRTEFERLKFLTGKYSMNQ